MNPNIKSLLFGGRGTGSAVSDVALLIVRVSIGLLIALGHGKGKLFHDGTFGIPEQLIQGTAKLGFPAPTFFAWCSVLTEFLGGLLLAIGLFTRPVAAFLAFNMVVAAFGALLHAPIVSMSGPSKELAAPLPLAVPALHLHRRRPLLRGRDDSHDGIEENMNAKAQVPQGMQSSDIKLHSLFRTWRSWRLGVHCFFNPFESERAALGPPTALPRTIGSHGDTPAAPHQIRDAPAFCGVSSSSTGQVR